MLFSTKNCRENYGERVVTEVVFCVFRYKPNSHPLWTDTQGISPLKINFLYPKY